MPTQEIVNILVAEYEDAQTDLETATVMNIANRLGMEPEVREKLEANGWDMEV